MAIRVQILKTLIFTSDLPLGEYLSKILLKLFENLQFSKNSGKTKIFNYAKITLKLNVQFICDGFYVANTFFQIIFCKFLYIAIQSLLQRLLMFVSTL